MVVSPLWVANSVLVRARREGVEVSSLKLGRVLFLLASEYGKAARRVGVDPVLFSELFLVWKSGPVLLSVHSVFGVCGGGPIRGFAVDVRGQGMMEDLEGSLLGEVFERVWGVVRGLSGRELQDVFRGPGSAWGYAWCAGEQFLSVDAVVEDQSFEALVGA